MDSRELVRRTLEFASPAGIPRQLWLLPWAELHHPEAVERIGREFPDDIVSAPAAYLAPLPVEGDRYRKGRYVDEWGCRFDNPLDGVIGIVREPLIADWSDLERLRPPEATLAPDVERINAFCRASDKFVLNASLARPFERLGFLRTLEQALVDLVLQPPELFALLDLIHGHYLKEVEAWSATEVDAICLMDDWGTQRAMMVAPDLWRRLFKPMYRDYAEIARGRGKYVFMHSDGWITDIIEDLIEVGVDALNSQVYCMGVAELGRRFRGRITFWGEVDRQNLLAFASPAEVREAVIEIKEQLYAGGGVIAQCEFGPAARPENVIEVFKTWDALAAGGPGNSGGAAR